MMVKRVRDSRMVRMSLRGVEKAMMRRRRRVRKEKYDVFVLLCEGKEERDKNQKSHVVSAKDGNLNCLQLLFINVSINRASTLSVLSYVVRSMIRDCDVCCQDVFDESDGDERSGAVSRL